MWSGPQTTQGVNALEKGTILGPYEILSPLGAGGMGEVYRATDTRLDRQVAIKVLPKQFSRSPEFLQRLQREAKVISNLTHPNICTLHDIGEHDGSHYLVMELLEGETLAQRIAKGPLPLELVLTVGAEIAAALDKAHRAGIVHRDLKPGNVILTKSGAKLLDFGLAKSAVDASGISSVPDAVTVSEPLTGKGTILGTFQYMAPEQLEGKEADARTDIFAFGAVLYEAATGIRAFSGKSRASLITSIMSATPEPISRVQPMSPPALDQVVRSCLEKDPEDRIQTTHDIKLQLQWISEGGSRFGAPVQVINRRKRRERAWAAGCLLAFAACIALAVFAFRPQPENAHRVWSNVMIPEGSSLYASGDAAGPVVISPDGTMLAFVASDAEAPRIWIRPLRDPTARPLPGTDGATFPFWSPDSRQLGFFAGDKLYTVNVVGAPPIPLCEAQGGRGGTWNHDSVILFAPAFRSAIFRVAATGGQPRPVTSVDKTKHTSHRWPEFCPDGRHFLYVAVAHGTSEAKDNALYLGSLDGREPTLVLRGAVNAAVTADRLMYVRQNTLMAVPFDVISATTIGPPAVVASGVLYDVSIWRAGFSVSDNGIIAFHSGIPGGAIQITRRDRSGMKLGTIGEAANFGSLSLSPDGTRVATEIVGAETDVWVYEVERGIRSRLSFENGSDIAPIWSADSTQLAYAHIHFAQPQTPRRIERRPAIGGDAEVLYSSLDDCWPTDWSPDGKYLLITCGNYIGANETDIFVLSVMGDPELHPVVQSPFRETQGQFSPDGKWIAYHSDASSPGRSEVFIIPFNPPDEQDGDSASRPRRGKWQVSTRGGLFPRWCKEGKELVFLKDLPSKDLPSGLTAVEIELAPTGVRIGVPTTLFEAEMVAGTTPFDASVDGTWFVQNLSGIEAAATINVITNWSAKLSQK